MNLVSQHVRGIRNRGSSREKMPPRERSVPGIHVYLHTYKRGRVFGEAPRRAEMNKKGWSLSAS